MLGPLTPGVPRVTSATRSDWVPSTSQLLSSARQVGDADGQRLVNDVVSLLGQLGRGEGEQTFRAQPFGGQSTVILPGLLSFQPTPRDAAPSDDRVARALQRTRVPFGSTGF